METIRKMILALCTVLGGVIIFTLLKELTPQWVFYTVLSAFSLFVLYYVSKPDKTYWCYTYVSKGTFGIGTMQSKNKYFPMGKALSLLSDDTWIVSTTLISEEEYMKTRSRISTIKEKKEQSSTTPQK